MFARARRGDRLLEPRPSTLEYGGRGGQTGFRLDTSIRGSELLFTGQGFSSELDTTIERAFEAGERWRRVPNPTSSSAGAVLARLTRPNRGDGSRLRRELQQAGGMAFGNWRRPGAAAYLHSV